MEAGLKSASRCLLHAHVAIYDDVGIGARGVLHSGCVLGADGFGFVPTDGYEKFPQVGRVEIGDDVEIGANACVDRAALGVTRSAMARNSTIWCISGTTAASAAMS